MAGADVDPANRFGMDAQKRQGTPLRRSRIEAMEAALRALGRRLVVEAVA